MIVSDSKTLIENLVLTYLSLFNHNHFGLIMIKDIYLNITYSSISSSSSNSS